MWAELFSDHGSWATSWHSQSSLRHLGSCVIQRFFRDVCRQVADKELCASWQVSCIVDGWFHFHFLKKNLIALFSRYFIPFHTFSWLQVSLPPKLTPKPGPPPLFQESQSPLEPCDHQRYWWQATVETKDGAKNQCWKCMFNDSRQLLPCRRNSHHLHRIRHHSHHSRRSHHRNHRTRRRHSRHRHSRHRHILHRSRHRHHSPHPHILHSHRHIPHILHKHIHRHNHPGVQRLSFYNHFSSLSEMIHVSINITSGCNQLTPQALPLPQPPLPPSLPQPKGFSMGLCCATIQTNPNLHLWKSWPNWPGRGKPVKRWQVETLWESDGPESDSVHLPESLAHDSWGTNFHTKTPSRCRKPQDV